MARKKKNPVMKSAWLITWEDWENKPKEPQIACILRVQRSPSFVESLMRFIYSERKYSYAERFEFARHPKNAPPLLKDMKNGVSRVDVLTLLDAGGDEWLYARRVTDLRVIREGTKEIASWTEPPPLRWKDKSKLEVEKAGPGKQRQAVRSI